MDNHKEKVSIIITTYKGSNVLKRSVLSLINQTYNNLEIIVVDDNPPESLERDSTEKVMASFTDKRILYVRHKKNLNGAAARNTGIRVATGEYIGFLDDDDYYYPSKIEMCVQSLTENSTYDAVFCGVVISDNVHVLKVIQPKIYSDMQKKLLFNVNMFGTGSNLFLRRNSIIELGGFDVSYYRLQDLEFLVRFFENHKACCINKLLIVKARSESNNMPEYKRLFEIKQKFYKDFLLTLSTLNNEELNDYYTNEYARLLQSCFGKETREVMLKAKGDLENYRQITVKEKVFFLFTLIGKPNNNLYTFIRTITSAITKPVKSALLKRKFKINNQIINY